ncbi:potassium channel family protein [Agarivorans sp. QJM3NY_33]|uniref:potassium channel family protein n=1 Tax=Agarivorans sp. QJM3NY_33 TaxID=3421432 RepID=UPI003D7CCA40
MKKLLIWSEKNNFIFLTLALIGYIFLAACVDQFWQGDGFKFLQAAMVLVLAAGVWQAKGKKLWFAIGLGFLLSTTLIAIFNLWFEAESLAGIYLGFVFCYLVISTWTALKQVLFTGEIDTNKLVGAICIFLLVGLGWAHLYTILNSYLPEAFSGVSAEHWSSQINAFIYFSFVTLTTLGYGEITPKVPITRFFTFSEAIFGVFYMAILVASLVGARMSKRER